MQQYTPTQEQKDKLEELLAQDYIWDIEKSAASAGVILIKNNDVYFFGLDGTIVHDPEFDK